ncbi:MinD/ParA family protein, partial [Verminephrobacter sp. Larva24]
MPIESQTMSAAPPLPPAAPAAPAGPAAVVPAGS